MRTFLVKICGRSREFAKGKRRCLKPGGNFKFPVPKSMPRLELLEFAEPDFLQYWFICLY